MIQTFNIRTCMGWCHNTLPFLNEAELKEFKSIVRLGRTTDGKYNTCQNYFNSLGKGDFKVEETYFDNGTTETEYLIIQVT